MRFAGLCFRFSYSHPLWLSPGLAFLAERFELSVESSKQPDLVVFVLVEIKAKSSGISNGYLRNLLKLKEIIV